MNGFACLLASPAEEEFFSQFLEPIAVYDRQGPCLYKSKRFLSTLRETNIPENYFSRAAHPESHLYTYWQKAIEQDFCEFTEPQLFCSFHAMSGADAVVLKIQKSPLQLIVNSINYATAVVNQELEVTCCNQQFIDLLELGIQSPFSGFQLNQLVHPEDQNIDRSLWKDLIKGRISEYNIEKRFLSGSQRIIWTNVHMQGVPPEEVPGTNLFYTVILEDISDVKASYEALILDHQRWNVFLSNRLNLFFQTNLSGRIYSVSNAVVTTLGYPHGVLKGMQIADLVHPRDRANFLRFLKLWSQPDQPAIIVECCFQKYHSQEEVYLYIHGQQLAGTLASSGILFYAVDITERKQLEQEIQAKEERYRSLVSNLPGAVYRSSSDLSNNYSAFEVISPEIERITGYSAHEFLRNPNLYQSLILEDDQQMIKQTIVRAIALQEPFTIEYQIRDAAGNLRWVQDRARCVVNESGRLLWIDGVLLDVTQQKQSEELLRAVFEQAAVGINLMDREGNLIRVNQKQCEMLGYSESEMLGLAAMKLTLPEEHQKEQKLLQALLDGKIKSYSIDKLDVKKNGELLWVTITMSAIWERDNPKYVVTIVQDITERKQVEAERAAVRSALESSEAQLRLMFESAPIGVSITDQNGRIVRTNAAMQEFLGYSQAELRQVSFDHYTHPEDLEADLQRFQALISGTISHYQLEKRYIHKDGTIVWGNLQIASEIDRHGELLTFAFLEDITERKQQEQRLREQEAELRAIFEASPFGIGAIDRAGNFLRINKAYQEVMGYEFSQLSGVTFRDLTYSDDLNRDLELYEKVLRGELDTYQIEKRYIRPDGSIFWGRLTVVAVRQPDGQLQFSFGLTEDIDEQKQVEQEQKRAEQAANHFLQLLRSSLELSTDGILLLDLQWHLIHYNEQFMKLWEISEETLDLHDDWRLVNAMKQKVVEPEQFVAQIQEEYRCPQIEDIREWQLLNGKTYLRISRPQVIDGRIVGRVVSYREIKTSTL